ncbi:MAG: tRNA (adenosine(37)-N6)-dimethylallyltransferase MiaA [Bacteroidales bacterium]|nr:tRNA (adenosine(37)-N6)-dimethylallyltransferase MiaA [Bacteroidales bacterium]
MKDTLITIVGPTASGKTRLAVSLASALVAEIISGDSRQVYRGMDIGTGKDLSEYTLGHKKIPYHLIDIADAGYKYNVYEYQRDFIQAYTSIRERGRQAILCGGTGLYIESVLKGYKLVPVPADALLRSKLEQQTLSELIHVLSTYKSLHNTTDVDTVKRAIRAIEIEEYYKNHPEIQSGFPDIPHIVFGLQLDREERRKRISQRLKSRLDEGMVEEVQALLDKGIPVEDLIYYGLEYKYVSLYITGVLSFTELFDQLEIAIHQFAKRQMTWFRGMEKRGISIVWLNALDDAEANVRKMLEEISRAC